MPEKPKRANGKPILELSTNGPTKSRGLTLGQIEKAERMVASGEATLDEMEAKYPGYQEASRVLRASMADLAESMSGFYSKGITESMQSIFKQLDTSRLGLGESLKRATESAFRMNDIAIMKPETLPLTLRDPDAATRRVAAEVRDLAESMVANSKAALDQNAALVRVMTELKEAGAERDRASAKRDTVALRLAAAAVFLGLVSAIPTLRDVWSETETLRSWGSLLVWLLRQVGLPPIIP